MFRIQILKSIARTTYPNWRKIRGESSLARPAIFTRNLLREMFTNTMQNEPVTQLGNL